MMHRRGSAGGCLLPSCTSNIIVRDKICRKPPDRKGLNLRDGRDDCPMRTPVAIRYGAKYVTTNLN